MATIEDLVNSLQKEGRAEHEITPRFPVQVARARLLAAAQEVGVRVSVSRDYVNNQMVATTLDTAQSAEQAHRTAFYTAANLCKKAVELLQTNLRDPVQYGDVIDDLGDIAVELQGAGDAAKAAASAR